MRKEGRQPVEASRKAAPAVASRRGGSQGRHQEEASRSRRRRHEQRGRKALVEALGAAAAARILKGNAKHLMREAKVQPWGQQQQEVRRQKP